MFQLFILDIIPEICCGYDEAILVTKKLKQSTKQGTMHCMT